jgi:polyether ionophore transport system permease protein
MLRTVWSKTLWEYRIAILGWGIGLAILIFIHYPYYSALSLETRNATQQYAQNFRFLGEPVALTTPGGYATWHTLGLVPIILGIWTVLAGARLVRGEEERGSLDLLLATPWLRVRVLVEKLAALIITILVISLLFALGAVLGEASTGMQVDVAGALLGGLNIGITAFLFGMLALLLSQVLLSQAAAAGIAGALMVLAYLVNGIGRVVEHGEWIQRLSPLYYYDLSKPLIPTYGTNAGALLFLLALGVLLAIISIPLFVRRDIGGTALPSWKFSRWGVRSHAVMQVLESARHDISMRTVALRALRAQAFAVIWWLLALAVFAGYITLISRITEDSIRKILGGTPALAQLFSGYDVATNEGIMAAILTLFLPAIAVLLAMTQALTWSSDLERGRLEPVLSTPQPRWRVILERFCAVFIVAAIVPLVVWLSIVLCAQIAGLSLDSGHLAAASFGMLPLELITAAFIYVLAGWMRPGTVVAIASILIALSYFAELLNPFLKLPEWLLSFSIFHQYGNPLVGGPRWGPWLILVGIALVFLTFSLLRFQRSDVHHAV